MSSPTQRTLKLLREKGYVAQVVEYTVPKVFVKRDLFGVIDIVALLRIQHGDAHMLAVQATSGSNRASRVEKLLASEEAALWCATGAALEVWAWRKVRSAKILKSGRRSRQKVWEPLVTKLGWTYGEDGLPRAFGVLPELPVPL